MLLLRLMLFTQAAGLSAGDGDVAGKNDGRHFEYVHHGQEWRDGQCGSRSRQSPINFGPAAPWNCDVARSPTGCYKGPVYFQYQVIDKGFPLSNSGHKLSADLRGEGYGGVTYNDQWFEIVSVDFHVQAEHTLMGEHLPIELNIVHKNVDSEQLLIVGVLFEYPNATKSALLEAHAPFLAKRSEGSMPPSVGQAAHAVKVAKRMAPATSASSPAAPVHASNPTILKAATPAVDQHAVHASPWQQETGMPRRQGSLASTAVAVSSNGSLRVELLSMSILGRGGGKLRNSVSRLLVVGEIMGRPDSTKGIPVPVNVAGNSGLSHEQDRSNTAAHVLSFPRYSRGDALRFSAYDSDGSLLGQTLLHSESIFGSAAAATAAGAHAAAAMQTAASGRALGFEGDLVLSKGSRGSGSLRVKAMLPLPPNSPASVPLLLQRQQIQHHQGSHRSISRGATTPEDGSGAGEASHGGAELGLFMSNPLPEGGETSQVGVREPADLLSQLVVGATFFEYQGSLTAPPCTEQVTWLVRRDRLMATQAQFEALRSTILHANANFGNWRSTMPLMGREIFVRVASLGMPPVPSASPDAANAQHQQSKTEGPSGDKASIMHAEVEAEDALTAARDAESLTRSIQSVIPPR